MYLSTIMDAFNHEIISWVISESPSLQETLKQALRGRNVEGVTFFIRVKESSIKQSNFRCILKKGIITSMSRKGNCHDNAMMKSFFGHLKSEAFYSQNF
ncbi:hypothetical protein DUD82_28320 [Bacillus toyonensis]|nr:DDE-type integrase/transposase/recombinase [Bacillus toyonensis]